MAVMRRNMTTSGAVLIRGGAPASSAPIGLRSSRGSLGTSFLTPGGGPFPLQPSNGGGGGGGIIDELIDIGSDFIRDRLGIGGGGGTNTAGGGQPGTGNNLVNTGGPAACPEGTFRVPGLGTCLDLQPGGATQGAGVVVSGGEAVVGAFNLPARVPEIVGVMADGNPIRRCPKRHVLGLDNLCYVKGTITRQFRKWVPSAKPPVSAHDAKMMRKYGRGGSKAKAAKKLAMEAGFACKQK